MEQQTSDLLDLQIDQQTQLYLGETARWGRFLSIVGFVMCGIIVLFSFFAGSILSIMGSAMSSGLFAMGGAALTVVYLLIALLYFFPCLYLYNFSTKMKAALASRDQALLNTSFRNLKACFRYLGILTLVILSFYALMIVIGIIGATMR